MNHSEQIIAFSRHSRKCFWVLFAMDTMAFMERGVQYVHNDFKGNRVLVLKQSLLCKLTIVFNSILTSRCIPIVVCFIDRYEHACRTKVHFTANLSAINQYS